MRDLRYFYHMEIQHSADDKGGRFFVADQGRQLAAMTYIWAGQDRIIIDHTEVGPSLKGKGVGNQMVAAAVDMARRKGIKIVPLCPFAKAVMTKHTDYNDVL